jgi:hypothetical protein
MPRDAGLHDVGRADIGVERETAEQSNGRYRVAAGLVVGRGAVDLGVDLGFHERKPVLGDPGLSGEDEFVTRLRGKRVKIQQPVAPVERRPVTGRRESVLHTRVVSGTARQERSSSDIERRTT